MKNSMNIRVRAVRILLCSVACTALLLGARLSEAQNSRPTDGLITKVDQAQLTHQQQHYLNTVMGYEQYVSHEIVQVNIDLLREVVINVNVGGGTRIVVNQHKFVERGSDSFSWFGTVEEYPVSSVNIVANGDMVSANFRFGGDLYSLWPLGEGLHAWTHEDGSRFSDHNEDSYNELPSYDMKNGPQERRFDGGKVERYVPAARDMQEEGFRGGAPDCKIRLLVAFTDDVDVANGDPRGQIQLAIDNYNNSSSNSEVNFDVEVARIVEVSYAESGVFSTDRNRFRNTADGFMDNIHDLRELYDADYCQLVVQNVNSGEGCGLAYGIGVTYADAFCASKYSCIAGNLTFAHEFAHLHGCRHDPFVDPTMTPFAYGHGYTNPTDAWRTVMAYNNACTDAGTSCTRIQWWSTPDVNVSAAWGSDPAGIAGISNNEAALDNTEVTVAGWEAMVTNKSVYDPDIIYDDEEGNFEGLTSVSTVSSASTYLDYRSGSKGYLKASDSVTLQPGFWARSGTEVSVYLETCAVVTAAPEVYSRESAPNVTDEQSVINDLVIAPNPFCNQVKISLDVEEDVTFDVYLLDAYGKVVNRISEHKFFFAGVHQIDLDTRDLAAGYFMLVVENDTNRIVKQLIRTDR
jgi:hypothetical protein